MIPQKVDGKQLSLAGRLKLAGDAGFDGVDLDQAAGCTPEEARQAANQEFEERWPEFQKKLNGDISPDSSTSIH